MLRSAIAELYAPARVASAELAGGRAERWHLVAAVCGTLLVAAAASALSIHQGLADAYGDATHHLVIARRMLDSPTPGFAQLGTVWLPLPHLLLVPLVMISPLIWTAAAGAVLGALSMALAAAATFAVVRRATGRYLPAYVAVAVLVSNPNLLYLQSSAMTEALFIAAVLLIAYQLYRWLRSRALGDLLVLGVALGVAVATRYDGWFVFLAVTFVVVAATLARTQDQDRAVANGITVAALPAFVIFLWAFYNWLIFGDPLEFSHGELAAATQAAEMGVEATRLHPLGAAWAYATAVLANDGAVALLAGAIALLWAVVRYRRSPLLWVLLVLASPAAFNVVSLLLGQSVIRTNYTDPPGSLNIRYGIQAWPLLAVASGLAVGALRTRRARRLAAGVALAAVAAQLALFAPFGAGQLVSLEDARHERPEIAATNAAATWFREHREPGERALLHALATPDSSRFFLRARVPMRNFITDSDDELWAAALAEPSRFVDWLVVAPVVAGRDDRVRELVSEGRHVFTGGEFLQVGEAGGWRFFRRTPARPGR